MKLLLVLITNQNPKKMLIPLGVFSLLAGIGMGVAACLMDREINSWLDRLFMTMWAITFMGLGLLFMLG